MRKLLFLLFIPLVSFGQLTFKDVMSISSLDQFKRVMIENTYEFNDIDDDGWVSYGFNIVRDSIDGNRSSSWTAYNKTDNRWAINFSRGNKFAALFGAAFGVESETDTSKNSYDLIVEEIKEKCKYYKIANYKGDDYAYYSCPPSSYKGKIGFAVVEGWGQIRHFPEE